MVPYYRLVVGGCISLSFNHYAHMVESPGRNFFVKIGQNLDVSESDLVRVDIFQFLFSKLRNKL